LSLALYDQYKQEGEPFKVRFLKLLAAGGSRSPLAILQKANIDVYASSFWQGGFNVLARILDQLEAMA
jgi:oligoendopeptidase F